MARNSDIVVWKESKVGGADGEEMIDDSRKSYTLLLDASHDMSFKEFLQTPPGRNLSQPPELSPSRLNTKIIGTLCKRVRKVLNNAQEKEAWVELQLLRYATKGKFEEHGDGVCSFSDNVFRNFPVKYENKEWHEGKTYEEIRKDLTKNRFRTFDALDAMKKMDEHSVYMGRRLATFFTLLKKPEKGGRTIFTKIKKLKEEKKHKRALQNGARSSPSPKRRKASPRRIGRSAVSEEFQRKVRAFVDNLPPDGRVMANLSSLGDWKLNSANIKFLFEALPDRVELLNMSGGKTKVWGKADVDALIAFLKRSRVYYIDAGETEFEPVSKDTEQTLLSSRLYPALKDTYVGFVFFDDTKIPKDDLNKYFRNTNLMKDNILVKNRGKNPEWYHANWRNNQRWDNPLFRIAPWFDVKEHDSNFTEMMSKAFYASHNSILVYLSMKKWIREWMAVPDGRGGLFHATEKGENGLRRGILWPNVKNVLYYEGQFEDGKLVDGIVRYANRTEAVVKNGVRKPPLKTKRKRDKPLLWYLTEVKRTKLSAEQHVWLEKFIKINKKRLARPSVTVHKRKSPSSSSAKKKKSKVVQRKKTHGFLVKNAFDEGDLKAILDGGTIPSVNVGSVGRPEIAHCSLKKIHAEPNKLVELKMDRDGGKVDYTLSGRFDECLPQNFKKTFENIKKQILEKMTTCTKQQFRKAKVAWHFMVTNPGGKDQGLHADHAKKPCYATILIPLTDDATHKAGGTYFQDSLPVYDYKSMNKDPKRYTTPNSVLNEYKGALVFDGDIPHYGTANNATDGHVRYFLYAAIYDGEDDNA